MNCANCELVKDWDALEDKRCIRCRTDQKVGSIHGFYTNADLLYHFVESRLSPEPFQVHSKRQYKRFLKSNGFVDKGSTRMDVKKFKNRPFDRTWDKALDQALDQSIAEVKKKPYSIVGKKLSHQEAREVLRNDYKRQFNKKELVHA